MRLRGVERNATRRPLGRREADPADHDQLSFILPEPSACMRSESTESQALLLQTTGMDRSR